MSEEAPEVDEYAARLIIFFEFFMWEAESAERFIRFICSFIGRFLNDSSYGVGRLRWLLVSAKAEEGREVVQDVLLEAVNESGSIGGEVDVDEEQKEEKLE